MILYTQNTQAEGQAREGFATRDYVHKTPLAEGNARVEYAT